MARINRTELQAGLTLLGMLFGRRKRKLTSKLFAAAAAIDAYELVRTTLPQRARAAANEERAIRLSVEETYQLADLFDSLDAMRGKLVE